jgi:hypothetical protein
LVIHIAQVSALSSSGLPFDIRISRPPVPSRRQDWRQYHVAYPVCLGIELGDPQFKPGVGCGIAVASRPVRALLGGEETCDKAAHAAAGGCGLAPVASSALAHNIENVLVAEFIHLPPLYNIGMLLSTIIF